MLSDHAAAQGRPGERPPAWRANKRSLMPETTLEIEEHEGRRAVRLSGPAFYHGAWHGDGARFETHLRAETLRALFETKRAFLYDEILRVEDPHYVRDPLIGLVAAHTDPRDKRILDFGCGCASSTVLLARAGARVTGVEPNTGNRRAGQLRIEDEGYGDRAHIAEHATVDEFPFQPESFDVIVLSAVVEHIEPRERRPIMQALWTYLRPGGLFVVTETPNRLWPYDGHTTRLPLVSWLPLPLACRLARRLRPGEFGDTPTETLVADGIVGSTWWSLASALPSDRRPLPVDSRREYAAYFERLRARKRGAARFLVEGLRLGLYPLTFLLDRGDGRRPPINAVFPYLNVGFVKGRVSLLEKRQSVGRDARCTNA
ncbi:MAG: methyltransferase domain-containing protein [Candidatus Eisenbacteria bacterium]|nr:methyltransferase domain-containing protein [Candidatus Eisenbacteria bacterium]